MLEAKQQMLKRSIPTCVGQPRHYRYSQCSGPVYPHVCGATQLGWIVLVLIHGLSPRVWGNPHHHYAYGAIVRSIPTCVGQPNVTKSYRMFFPVYPHVCGATSEG